ncbi:MAG: DUF1694 domain-containing protein [Pseudolactococcus laudensis]|uniref:YueI family protein n=1 Tax=Pseudolactococcus laudensis TaxID=1494461 RepID=A0A7V8SJX0_9LACT|nr:DUF1694 domain-containing protein [Lactococcus laudensis]MBA0016410.1 YueI family protein [Lactococcus laudensis]MBR2764185.1 YueI family protein [Lactococcus sp.]MBW9281040.1 DUF1694 domain-containing protein [Lactococcus laudensis]
MTNLENRLDRASSGEYRLNPDEQKLYLNTFRERIFLAITFDDAKIPLVKTSFNQILSHFDMADQPIFVKICGDLPDDLTGYYLKLAVDHHFEGQILTEPASDRYGIVIHTDHAINLDKIELLDVFPDLLSSDAPAQPTKKKSFFSKLFG